MLVVQVLLSTIHVHAMNSPHDDPDCDPFNSFDDERNTEILSNTALFGAGSVTPLSPFYDDDKFNSPPRPLSTPPPVPLGAVLEQRDVFWQLRDVLRRGDSPSPSDGFPASSDTAFVSCQSSPRSGYDRDPVVSSTYSTDVSIEYIASALSKKTPCIISIFPGTFEYHFTFNEKDGAVGRRTKVGNHKNDEKATGFRMITSFKIHQYPRKPPAIEVTVPRPRKEARCWTHKDRRGHEKSYSFRLPL